MAQLLRSLGLSWRHFWAILPAAVVLLSLGGCDDPIDLNLNTASPYLVVDGRVDNRPQEADTVILRTSVAWVGRGDLPFARGAEVIISGSDGQIDTLQELSPGKYVTRTLVGEPLQSYTLDITWQGERFRATDRIPRAVLFDSIQVRDLPRGPGIQPGWYMFIFAQEPPGRGDHYFFSLAKNDTLQDLPTDLAFTSDELVDGNYINGAQLNQQPFKVGDRITGYIRTITQGAYFFYLELANSAFQGGLFSAPPANVRTNVRNLNPDSRQRVTGYFFTVTEDRASLVVGQ